jgi:hypothetical protein
MKFIPDHVKKLMKERERLMGWRETQMIAALLFHDPVCLLCRRGHDGSYYRLASRQVFGYCQTQMGSWAGLSVISGIGRRYKSYLGIPDRIKI